MNRWLFTGVFALLLLSVSVSGAGIIPEDLRIITEVYPPYNYEENGTLKGIAMDLVEEVLDRLGTGIDRDSFEILPWEEGYAIARNRTNTILFSTARTPGREDQFLWAGPLASDRKLLFMRADPDSSARADPASLTIAVVSGNSALEYLISAGADPEAIITVPTISSAVLMVENGTADAFAYGEYAGREAIDRYAEDPSGFVEGAAIGEASEYIAFHPGTDPAFVTAVDTGIQELKRDRAETGITTYEAILSRYLPARCDPAPISRESIISLTDTTASALQTGADEAIAAINAGNPPFRDESDSDLYAFVFDTGVHLVANAVNQQHVGRNLSGTTDAYGKPFRDEMITLARENGSGWVSYVYSNPDSLGLYQKESYVKLVTGSDGAEYVAGSGRYRSCTEFPAAAARI